MEKLFSKILFPLSVTKSRRIFFVYAIAFFILISLSAIKIIFSYYNTVKSARTSIANQSIEMAKSIADSLDKQAYKRFLANPTRNNDYWDIRTYLDDARKKIGALYIYTLLIDNPKVSKGMIVGLPKDYPKDFPIGDPCTVPESEVKLAYQGKTYFTEILNDPEYGDYLSVGAPIKDNNGEVIGYIGIDLSAKMLDDISEKVIRNSVSTFVFEVVFIVILLLSFFFIQKWYQKEIKKAVGDTEEVYLKEFRSIINSIKSTKHDFVNHIHVLYGLIELKHFDKAIEYMNLLLKEVRFVDLSLKIANPALLVLFHTKWEMAQAKQIDIHFDVSQDSFDHIKSNDLIKLFSNLIDNAIEATTELPIDERKVEVVCKRFFNFYQFEVRNSGKMISSKEKQKIFLSGYTTKQIENGKSRGFGLSIVQEIVNKYSGEIQVESNHQITVFRILIPC